MTTVVFHEYFNRNVVRLGARKLERVGGVEYSLCTYHVKRQSVGNSEILRLSHYFFHILLRDDTAEHVCYNKKLASSLLSCL